MYIENINYTVPTDYSSYKFVKNPMFVEQICHSSRKKKTSAFIRCTEKRKYARDYGLL